MFIEIKQTQGWQRGGASVGVSKIKRIGKMGQQWRSVGKIKYTLSTHAVQDMEWKTCSAIFALKIRIESGEVGGEAGGK